MCLSQKFATSRNRDGRCSIELAIAARGVAPSGFYEWKMCDRCDGAPKCEMQGSPLTHSHMKAEQAAVLARHIRQRVRRLKAVASRLHSAFTLVSPLRVNCCAPSWFLSMAKSGSISGSRRRYACFASSVAIQSL